MLELGENMGETYRAFGSCILFKEVHGDDLGHFFRAGLIDGTSLGRTVWLRVLDADGLSAEKITEAFENARLIAETIQSAQLPTEPFYIEADGIPAFGGDQVAGQPLNRVLAQARDEAFPMQPDNALLIAEKIALALTAGMAVDVGGQALAHGFLHPGLIVLSNDGEAQVAGFGLADAFLSALESPGAVTGSLAYLAPEVVENRTPSKSGDVYSLGAILFHLLTGTALPASPNDRGAALEAAMLAYDGEPLPDDIRSIVTRSLAPAPENRFGSAADFKTELDQLIYGGNYSPTTFNLALFMDRLFRADIEADEATMADEQGVDVSAYLELEPEPEPEAVEPAEPRRDNRFLWAAIAGAVIVVAAIGIFWGTGGFGPPQPPPVPTPTAAEIEARRQAQEDRLKTLTQEMVQEMMAERETEIREELIGRQQRIEELQQRLYRSERRAKQNAAAAAEEAKTQRELKQKIEEEEKAKRDQEEALQAEIEKPVDEPKPIGAGSGSGAAAATGAMTGTSGQSGGEAPKPQAKKPTPIPPTPKPTAVPEPTVKFGDFVSPEKADTLPVVIKSEPLTWPRSAMSSTLKGLVIVQVTVDASGSVDNVEILRADHTKYGIPEAALKAAAGYRFKPGTKDRVAITTNTFITWRYDFED